MSAADFYTVTGQSQIQDVLFALSPTHGLADAMMPNFERLGGRAANRIDRDGLHAAKHRRGLHPRDPRFAPRRDWIDDIRPIARWKRSPVGRLRHEHEPSRQACCHGRAGRAALGEIRFTYLLLQARVRMMLPISVVRHLNSSASGYGSEALKKGKKTAARTGCA